MAEQYSAQSCAHIKLTQALPDPRLVLKWTAEMEAWEHNRTQPNPYLLTFKHVSEAEVKLAMMQEELEEIKKGGPELDDTSASGCLSLRFFIKEQQCIYNFCPWTELISTIPRYSDAVYIWRQNITAQR